MKKLIPILLLFAACGPSSFSQDRIDTIPIVEGYYWVFRNDTLTGSYRNPPKRDTISEWMHVSCTRSKGFVIARKALSVRVNGYCVAHLDCDRKPFPVHYHIGWCEGKDKLLTAFLNGRAKQ
jgi:hypothetical protein